MKIMPYIYLKDSLSHQQFISSILNSYHGVSINNMRPLEAVPMHKQKQFI